jgi:NHL repeat
MLGAYAIFAANTFLPNVSYFSNQYDAAVINRNIVQGQPYGLCIDNGLVYITVPNFNRIDYINPNKRRLNNINVYSGASLIAGNVAGQHNSPYDVCVDYNYNLYVTEYKNHNIRKFDYYRAETVSYVGGSTGNAGYANGSNGLLYYPNSITVDSKNCIYFTEKNNTIRKIDRNGILTTFAGISSPANGTSTDAVVGSVDGLSSNARFNNPTGIAVDLDDNIYVSDNGNNIIRKITPDGNVTTIAGTAGVVGSADGIGSAASFNNPNGLCCDFDGNIYVCDTSNYVIRKITKSVVNSNIIYTVSTLAGAGTIGDNEGDYNTARFNRPIGIKMLNNGNLIVTDSGAFNLKQIKNKTGSKTTFNIVLNYDMINFSLDRHLLKRGWDGVSTITCNLTVLSGVYVYTYRPNTSNENLQAFKISSALQGSTINITNSGCIVGAGGIHRVDKNSIISNGTDAMYIRSNITLKNYGIIGGGGGAGGSGGAYQIENQFFSNDFIVVGGDGAGKTLATSGTRRAITINGTPYSWIGGSGGALGQNGKSSSIPAGGSGTNASNAGLSIDGISFVTIDPTSTGSLSGATIN